MSSRDPSTGDNPPLFSPSTFESDDPLNFLKGVGRALHAERRRCGLSQQQVAEQLGVEPETVSRIENGMIAPSLVRLRQFSRVYGCSLEAFLSRTSDTLPDLVRRIAFEIDGLPQNDQLYVAEQAMSIARYLQGLRRER